MAHCARGCPSTESEHDEVSSRRPFQQRKCHLECPQGDNEPLKVRIKWRKPSAVPSSVYFQQRKKRLRRIISYCTSSYRIASHRIASHRIASHRIASHRIASHRIVSCRIILYIHIMYIFLFLPLFVVYFFNIIVTFIMTFMTFILKEQTWNNFRKFSVLRVTSRFHHWLLCSVTRDCSRACCKQTCNNKRPDLPWSNWLIWKLDTKRNEQFYHPVHFQFDSANWVKPGIDLRLVWPFMWLLWHCCLQWAELLTLHGAVSRSHQSVKSPFQHSCR